MINQVSFFDVEEVRYTHSGTWLMSSCSNCVLYCIDGFSFSLGVRF